MPYFLAKRSIHGAASGFSRTFGAAIVAYQPSAAGNPAPRRISAP
jgi:hypothetical protein